MTRQHNSSRAGPGQSYRQAGNQSQSTLQPYEGKTSIHESRSSLLLSGSTDPNRYSSVVGEIDGPGPAGFIHEAVVPQPPPEWQPFGYPLAHVICLVTAYSEGADGIRTTLASIATTDYPNTNKIF